MKLLKGLLSFTALLFFITTSFAYPYHGNPGARNYHGSIGTFRGGVGYRPIGYYPANRGGLYSNVGYYPRYRSGCGYNRGGCYPSYPYRGCYPRRGCWNNCYDGFGAGLLTFGLGLGCGLAACNSPCNNYCMDDCCYGPNCSSCIVYRTVCGYETQCGWRHGRWCCWPCYVCRQVPFVKRVYWY